MKPVIEFCKTNLENGAQKALENLNKDPNLDIEAYDCLENCPACAQSLYALVNKEIIKGNDPDDLVENIYKHLN
ncbi:DUF1450 domain-containing protein [Chengkuizengella sp. SCS-71B]|uniref:DUF1450 domain-containing protein n=1 Tax=Chengkuizengella sp. SCS-71B TaxID=3115290 RepID=UPI0039B77E8C